jgi:hypothetical protein
VCGIHPPSPIWISVGNPDINPTTDLVVKDRLPIGCRRDDRGSVIWRGRRLSLRHCLLTSPRGEVAGRALTQSNCYLSPFSVRLELGGVLTWDLHTPLCGTQLYRLPYVLKYFVARPSGLFYFLPILTSRCRECNHRNAQLSDVLLAAM